jgi:hypothetical protein
MGLRIVGDGASRLIRLVFKRGSPREAAFEALAASLQSTAGGVLAKCLRETEGDGKRLDAGSPPSKQAASRRPLTAP